MSTRPGVFVSESVLPTPVADQPAASAAGALLAELPAGPATPTLVTSWYGFTQLFGGLSRSYPATFAANLFFRSGGRELYVARAIRSDATKASATLKAADNSATWLTFTAKSAGSYGNNLRVVITKNNANLYDLAVLRESGAAGVIADDTVLETYTDLNLATFGSTEVVNTLAVRSQYVNVAWGAVNTAVVPASFPTLSLAGGSNGVASTIDYTSPLTALGQLDRALVLFSPGNTDLTAISAMTAFASANGGFVVLDTGENLTPAQALSYAGTAGVSTYAAVYYPWLWVPDTTSASRDAVVKVAPSGAVAGTILATDAGTGVFKAPAGIEANLPGVVALERALTATELDSLNSNTSPVNAIRQVAGVGPAVMGARTLDQSAATRYINVRRSLDFLSREMKSRLEFALFRNNDKALWGQLRTSLDTFLVGFWTAGGLRGATKAAAYYIKIDAENNTASDIANGIVNIEVGVALQYPAEFIKIKLTQQTLS